MYDQIADLKTPLSKRQEYAQKQLGRFHSKFSIYYVHPRTQWTYRFATILIVLFMIIIGVCFVLITIEIAFWLGIDLDQSRKILMLQLFLSRYSCS